MHRRVNSLVVCREDYDNKEDFRNAVKDAIMVLLDNNYIMTVRYDEKSLGIVAIDYDYENEEFGCPRPIWLLPEEEETVVYNEGYLKR